MRKLEGFQWGKRRHTSTKSILLKMLLNFKNSWISWSADTVTHFFIGNRVAYIKMCNRLTVCALCAVLCVLWWTTGAFTVFVTTIVFLTTLGAAGLTCTWWVLWATFFVVVVFLTTLAGFFTTLTTCDELFLNNFLIENIQLVQIYEILGIEIKSNWN